MASTASRTLGMALVAAALCVACEPPDSSAFGLPEAATDEVDAGAHDATPSSHDGSTHDATSSQPEAGEPEGAAADAPAGSTPADSATDTTTDAVSLDAGSSDAGSTETGTPDTSTIDAPVCTAGPDADYQASCTACSVSTTCVLTCTSCTTKAQTQNPNPSLQLPCTGTESVQNEDGVLTCQ